MPKNYEWERHAFEWQGWKHGSRCCDPVTVPDTGDKIGDLYRLAVACRMEKKASEIRDH